MKRLLLPVLLLGLLGGCAAPQTAALRKGPVDPEGAVTMLKEVPVFAGGGHDHGPEAMATLLQHTGRPEEPAQLEADIVRSGPVEDLPLALADAARRRGRLVYPLGPQLEAVLISLQQGFPVLVRQDRGVWPLPLPQYGVVVGADRSRERFTLQVGGQRQEVDFVRFERAWARAGNLGWLVLDPAGLPDTLDPRGVVRELALIQQAGAVADAQAGFNQAVLNWPEQRAAWVGLASTSVALGQEERAEAVLRELVRRAPDYGPGLNNLADLLMRTGRPLEALPLAERAVAALDIPATRATLRAVRAAVEPLQSEALPPLKAAPQAPQRKGKAAAAAAH